MFQSHKGDEEEELDLSGEILPEVGDEPPKPKRDPGTPGRASRAAAKRAAESKSDTEKSKRKDESSKVKRAGTVSNPMRTRSAAERRAEREVRRKSVTEQGVALRRESQPRKSAPQLDQVKIAELLENPTREVTEAELRSEYAYVVADLRSMGILAMGLVVVLIVLAQVLPK